MLWRGRLAVKIESAQPQSLSAEFELSGDALAGELILYTPLGTTAATLSWTAQSATLRANGDVRAFASLNELISHAVGTDVPVPALFAWLAGENRSAEGWLADLSQLNRGRITARRLTPAPPAELRLVLEK